MKTKKAGQTVCFFGKNNKRIFIKRLVLLGLLEPRELELLCYRYLCPRLEPRELVELAYLRQQVEPAVLLLEHLGRRTFCLLFLIVIIIIFSHRRPQVKSLVNTNTTMVRFTYEGG